MSSNDKARGERCPLVPDVNSTHFRICHSVAICWGVCRVRVEVCDHSVVKVVGQLGVASQMDVQMAGHGIPIHRVGKMAAVCSDDHNIIGIKTVCIDPAALLLCAAISQGGVRISLAKCSLDISPLDELVHSGWCGC